MALRLEGKWMQNAAHWLKAKADCGRRSGASRRFRRRNSRLQKLGFVSGYRFRSSGRSIGARETRPAEARIYFQRLSGSKYPPAEPEALRVAGAPKGRRRAP